MAIIPPLQQLSAQDVINAAMEAAARRKALHQRVEDFALAHQRQVVHNEAVNPGDEYIFVGKYELKVFVCEQLHPFTKRLCPTNVFAASHPIEKCFKVIGIPRPSEQTLVERLQFIQDEIASLKILIHRLSNK